MITTQTALEESKGFWVSGVCSNVITSSITCLNPLAGFHCWITSRQTYQNNICPIGFWSYDGATTALILKLIFIGFCQFVSIISNHVLLCQKASNRFQSHVIKSWINKQHNRSQQELSWLLPISEQSKIVRTNPSSWRNIAVVDGCGKADLWRTEGVRVWKRHRQHKRTPSIWRAIWSFLWKETWTNYHEISGYGYRWEIIIGDSDHGKWRSLQIVIIADSDHYWPPLMRDNDWKNGLIDHDFSRQKLSDANQENAPEADVIGVREDRDRSQGGSWVVAQLLDDTALGGIAHCCTCHLRHSCRCRCGCLKDHRLDDNSYFYYYS